MKFLQTALLLSLATISLAHPQSRNRASQKTETKGGITKTRICQQSDQEGPGTNFQQNCTEGTAGCECGDRFTEIKCSRNVQDGTGSSGNVSCKQSEEGVDGCTCDQTTQLVDSLKF